MVARRYEISLRVLQNISRLIRYKNAVGKVNEIEEEVKRQHDGDISLCVKRLAKE